MEKHIFDAAKKIESILNRLSENDQLFKELADIDSQLLQLGKYVDEEKIINKQTRTLNQTLGDLKSYSQIIVLYNYDNGYSLVEDTAGELHYIPTNFIEQE